MGCTSSHQTDGFIKPGEHGPLPLETVPFTGPHLEYHVTEVTISFKPDVKVGRRGAYEIPQMSSDVDQYYPTLAAQYASGFVLVTFHQIPFVMQRHGMFSSRIDVPFIGIFHHYPSLQTGERWQLRIEKSVMHVDAMATGQIVRRPTGQTTSNTSQLIDTVAACTENGGRLVCVEAVGMMSTMAMYMGYMSAAPAGGIGVDLFFNMPLHPNPTRYIYRCVSIPVPVCLRAGFGGYNIELSINFSAQLTHYLNQGYRLVEVFYDMSQTVTTKGVVKVTVDMTMNSIWFFEKEASRANDPTPVFEGFVVEYYLKIKSNMTGTSASAKWGRLLDEMGSKGWELVCFLETPKIVRSGFATAKQTLVLFFQRRIHQSGRTQGAVGGYYHDAPPSYHQAVGK